MCSCRVYEECPTGDYNLKLGCNSASMSHRVLCAVEDRTPQASMVAQASHPDGLGPPAGVHGIAGKSGQRSLLLNRDKQSCYGSRSIFMFSSWHRFSWEFVIA
eukprot:scaffold214743_cov17-Prasinocladus_malaysianus.AAC.1